MTSMDTFSHYFSSLYRMGCLQLTSNNSLKIDIDFYRTELERGVPPP